MSDSKAMDIVERFHQVSGVPKSSENMRIFLREAPDNVADTFLDLLDVLGKMPHLDYKIVCILRMILSMVQAHDRGVTSWSQAALKAGASREEIIEAMYAVIPQVGAIPVVRMLPLILEEPAK